MRKKKKSSITHWALLFNLLLTYSTVAAEIVETSQEVNTQHISTDNFEKYYSVTAAATISKQKTPMEAHFQTALSSIKNCMTRNQLTIDYAAEVGPVITSLSACYYRYPAYLWEESFCTEANGEIRVSKHLVSHWSIEQTTICPNGFGGASTDK